MQRQALLLLFGVILISDTRSFKIIGHLETPESGLLKNFGQGGGKEFEAVKHAVKGESGDRGYEAQHVEEKGLKGHHDKEDHQKAYGESFGDKKAHNHDNGYYQEQHKAEKGEKGYVFEDKGSYAKGHNTNGHHNIHKLNEYKKDTNFFDEDHDEAHKAKHGGFEVSKALSSGAAEKAVHGQKGYVVANYGKEGKFDKGHRYLDDKGFNKDVGYDGFYDHGDKFAKKGGEGSFKDYGFYKKGGYY